MGSSWHRSGRWASQRGQHSLSSSNPLTAHADQGSHSHPHCCPLSSLLDQRKNGALSIALSARNAKAILGKSRKLTKVKRETVSKQVAALPGWGPRGAHPLPASPPHLTPVAHPPRARAEL